MKWKHNLCLTYKRYIYLCSKCRTLKSSSPKLYQSRHNQFAIQFYQDTTHLALNATQGHKRRYRNPALLIQCSTRAESQALNATHWVSVLQCHTRTSLAIQKAIYRTQMMGTIRPGYISTQGLCASMPQKDTSLAIQQAIYRSQMMGTVRSFV